MEGVEKRMGDFGGRDAGGQEEKMNAVDIVTQTDLGKITYPPSLLLLFMMFWLITGNWEDVEAFVKGEIERVYPDHRYCSLPFWFCLWGVGLGLWG